MSSGWYGVIGALNGADEVKDKLGIAEASFYKAQPGLQHPLPISRLSRMIRLTVLCLIQYAYYAEPRTSPGDTLL